MNDSQNIAFSIVSEENLQQSLKRSRLKHSNSEYAAIAQAFARLDEGDSIYIPSAPERAAQGIRSQLDSVFGKGCCSVRTVKQGGGLVEMGIFKLIDTHMS